MSSRFMDKTLKQHKKSNSDNSTHIFPPPGPLASNYSSFLENPSCFDGILESSESTSHNTLNSQHGNVALGAFANTTSISIPDRGRYKKSAFAKAMDPFEVRIRFTQHLQHLNASVTSANKAAQYALKYRDMDEDLHSCILEQLEKNTMNTRANIMYFIEHLCDLAVREHHNAYVRMMERDIFRVVDAVAPEDGSGAANVKVVRRVLNALSEKSFITAQTVSELEEYLKERDTQADAVSLSSPVDRDVDMTDAYTPNKAPAKSNGYQQKFDKRQAEQRIEEDRERHKRLRETIWAVPNVGFGANRTPQEVAELDLEYDKLMEETSQLGEDDFDLYYEEADDRKFAAEDWREEHKSRAVGQGYE